ncbi:PspC domain-containing protein [Pedobacter sp. P351]|uniref:PspC domain-containing protein n=1 Tax=Pedobacter superstes TaxID=3133441 RepID=UPI0030A860FD
MNKTIIININGIVFHIEEDAYEILKSYMTEVKRHFAYSSDSEEIVTDIENRLAEMFSDRLAEQNKQVIIVLDVEEITAKMGRASDFETDDEEPFNTGTLKSSRTLYKDNDDRIIGGVCAGLGHYFNIEIKYVRLFTILLTLSGIGLIPYIVLWIVLPTAKTRQEKMAMKGEPINLQSFKKTFDEEADSLKQGEAKLYNEYPSQKSGDPILEIVNFFGKALKIALKVIGIVIITVGSFMLFALIIALLFGLGFVNNTEFQQFPFNIINDQYRPSILLSAFLLLIIPLIALILFAIRVILNRKVISRYGSFAMLILWLTGLGMGVYYGSRIAAEFREEAKFEQSSALKSYPALTLKLNPKLFFTQEDSLKYHIEQGEIDGRVIYGENDMQNELKHFDLFIERSDDSTLLLVKELSGRGKNFEKALEAAQRISYKVSQTDSIIQFDNYFTLTGNGLFRDQELDVHLKVPLNTRLRIDGNLRSRLRHYNLWECQPEDGDSNATSEWIMTEEGLKCVDEALFEKKRNGN